MKPIKYNLSFVQPTLQKIIAFTRCSLDIYSIRGKTVATYYYCYYFFLALKFQVIIAITLFLKLHRVHDTPTSINATYYQTHYLKTYESARAITEPVSYTHLTLPTIYSV